MVQQVLSKASVLVRPGSDYELLNWTDERGRGDLVHPGPNQVITPTGSRLGSGISHLSDDVHQAGGLATM